MVRYLRLTNEHIRYVVICSLLQQSSNCVCAKYTLLLNDNKQESVIFFGTKYKCGLSTCKSNLQVKINISAVRGSCRCPKNKDQKYFQALEALSKNVSLKFTSGNH